MRSAARILFTFAGGSGHAAPLVPIAAAVRAAGHSVAFAGDPSGTSVAEEAGFPVMDDPGEVNERTAVIAPLRALDMDHERRVLRDFYAGTEAGRRAKKVLELIEAWRPDLIVCDEVDFGSMIAAEARGIPHATVLVTAAGSFVRADAVAERLNALRHEHDLSPDPQLLMPARDLVLSPFPPSFRDPAFPLPVNALSFRTRDAATSDPASARRSRPPQRRLVYLTLGTVFNRESGDLFNRAIAGAGELPVELIVTVGRDVDPARFGAQPEHVRIERFIPQDALLGSCDLVINHGGSGSVIGALAHGLPMVVIPMGADQSLNAARCEQLGVGIALDAVAATPSSIREAVVGVLGTPDYRMAANTIAEEISALPGPESAVPSIERLVESDRTPLTAPLPPEV